jgi:hypothetical protein
VPSSSLRHDSCKRHALTQSPCFGKKSQAQGEARLVVGRSAQRAFTRPIKNGDELSGSASLFFTRSLVFRARTRSAACRVRLTRRAFTGAQYENSSEIGVFSRLTNAYCILAEGKPPPLPRALVCRHVPRRSAVRGIANFFFPVQAEPSSTG